MNIYQKWKQKEFDINHLFDVDMGQGKLLHLAAENGIEKAINALIDNGANINAKGSDNLTPLHSAAQNDMEKAIEILIQKGADVNEGYPIKSLHSAAKYRMEKAVNVLIRNGANVEGQDIAARTPLLCVVRKGHKGIADVLIKHIVKLKNSEEEKPKYLQNPDTDLKKELLKYWDQSLDEIERVRKEKIDKNITFYDILTGKNDQLISHVRRAKAVNYNSLDLI